MASGSGSTLSPDQRSERVVLVTVFAGLLLLVAIAMLEKGCGRDAPPPVAAAFDYFRAKALELGRDPKRVVAFVKDDVATLAYRGDVKGPLAALWNGGASPEEKLALARAILAHCPGKHEVALADVAGADKLDEHIFKLTVSHRKLAGKAPAKDAPRKEWRDAVEAGRNVDTPVWSGPIGELVGDVHSIETPVTGTTQLTLRRRSGAPVSVKVDTADALGEELLFTVERPGQDPLPVWRELWRADNRTGLGDAREGDRHDFVVLPCRISKYVREKEELLLKQRGREKAVEAEPYLQLLDYALEADGLMAKLEKERNVRAQYDHPRILFLGSTGKWAGEPVHTFDLRLNRTRFEGKKVDAFWACEIRGLVEAGLEHHFLERLAKGPVVSTWDVFNRMDDRYPNRPERRVEASFKALNVLRDKPGARARFRALGSDGKGSPGAPAVEVLVGPDKSFALTSGNLRAELISAARDNKDLRGLAFDDNRLEARFKDAGEAAAAIEASLLGAEGAARVDPDFVLEVALDVGAETPVVEGAVIKYAWGDGETRTTQDFKMMGAVDGLAYEFEVREGLTVAQGTRTLTGGALENAVLHNPHYRKGSEKQDDATSFCVSRKVLRQLKETGKAEISLLGKVVNEEAPRPVEWKGTLEISGRRSIKVQINGRAEDVPVLEAAMVGVADAPKLLIWDDAQFAIGKVDTIASIKTFVRCRVVDEDGIGVADADVGLTEAETLDTSWPDGGLRLPPPKGDSYGKINLVVTQHVGREKEVQRVEVDLTAPGLAVAPIKVKRLRTKVAYIVPGEEAKLDALDITPQVKRHARRWLGAKRIVIIPERTLPGGFGGVIGFFTLDPSSGDIVGVMEDGLHGSSMVDYAKYRKGFDSAGKDLIDSQGEADATAPLHAFRGALTAWWIFAAYKLQMASTEAVIQRMIDEVDEWEARTNMFTQLDEATGDHGAGDQLAGMIGEAHGGMTAINGSMAKAAFKIAYLGSLMFLEKQIG
ncbi:MAG: hypothetical protein IT462_16395 [Planctomycetes bacterium]|nr:hypothetical protein [Planctomycetota bacterium]